MSRRSRQFSLATTLALLALFAMAQTAYADSTLINTLPQPWAGYSYSPGSTLSAQSFRTGASDSAIKQVELNLYRDASVGSGTYFVDIYSSVSGPRPGSLIQNVGSGEVASLTTGFDNVVTFTGLSIVLIPSTEYFVVVRSPDV